MKIALITCPFGALPPVALGAVEKLFHQLAGEWVKSGAKVSFVCAGGGDNPQIDYIRLKRYERTGRTLTDLPYDFIYSLKALWKLPVCDVLVCNTFWSPVLAPLFRWKYKKLVYGVHRYPKNQFGLYRFVHSFVCVSTAIAEALMARIPSMAERIKIICNPIDVNVFKPSATSVRTDPSVFNIVYTGRVAEEKGLVHLAKAAQELSKDARFLKGRKLRLLLVGPWETTDGGGGVQYIQEVKREFPNVELLGPVYDPEKLAEVIRSCDIYCYPTIAERGEAFGIAPLEAISCGVPVVLPRFQCFSDYAKEGENCEIYEQPTEIADAIRRAVINGMQWDRDENYAVVRGRFSIAVIAHEYLCHFNSLCDVS